MRGRPDVYVHVGFNHWRHPTGIRAIKLEPMIATNVGFERAVIDVPEDAHDVDFVFSDNPDLHGGFVDNNHGFNYHFPVHGTSVAPQPLKIVHVTVEMAPIAKVGGLADVVTALGRAVQEEGHNVEVVMPKYDCIDYGQVTKLEQRHSFNFAGSHVQVWAGFVEGLRVTFIEPDNGIFWVGCIYGEQNDGQRFEYFCGAASEYLRIFNLSPDIVHCHDWQTAPMIWSDLAGARTVFTIHNLNYGVELIGRAMHATTVATTVSPTYATEISGSPAVESNFEKLYGVLNGIDVDIWDPSRDRFLPMNYNAETAVEGKAAVRQELRKRLNLAQIDVPIVGVVTRLTPQKGIHLIKHAAWRTLERGGQFVLLGSAPDPKIEHEFNKLAIDLKSQYPDRASLIFTYDEPLSHIIYAGCDFLLVPSIFEPCGLTQMIAMRCAHPSNPAHLGKMLVQVWHDPYRATNRWTQ